MVEVGVGEDNSVNIGRVDGEGQPVSFPELAFLVHSAVDENFGASAYGQLAHTSDFRIRERGPNDVEMGAFGFLLEAHKWRNIQIRFREFMPVGIRPLLIPVS